MGALARRISKADGRRPLTIVVVLGGAYIFAADLARCIRRKVQVEFVLISTYGNGTRPSARVTMRLAPRAPLKGKDVLVVEDIVDTGRTASGLLRLLARSRPRTLRLCSLLRKKARAEVAVKIDYLGFDVPDVFAVGYGLDFAGKFRNLRYVGCL